MSGEPVLDKTGKVVGIITNGSSPGELESPIYGFISLYNIKTLLQNEKVK